MVDTQTRITLAQCINIAKDVAIAQKGDKVTIKDIAALVTEIYIKLFKEAAKEAYLATRPTKTDTHVETAEDFVKAFKESKNPIAFRNANRVILLNFSKEDRDKILKQIN